MNNLDLALKTDQEVRRLGNVVFAVGVLLIWAEGIFFWIQDPETWPLTLLCIIAGLVCGGWSRWWVKSHSRSLQERYPRHARFHDYLAETVARVERVVDPGESIIALTTVYSGQQRFEAALTGERLYLILFAKDEKWGYKLPEVVDFWDTQLKAIGNLQHQRLAHVRTGATTGYRMIVPSNTLPTSTLESNKHDAKDFVQALDAAVARAHGMAAGTRDLAAQIDALCRLKDEGVLSADEFSRAKDSYLGKAPDAQELAARQLRSLKDLHSQGLLTDAELSAKKWDVLVSI